MKTKQLAHAQERTHDNDNWKAVCLNLRKLLNFGINLKFYDFFHDFSNFKYL